MGASSSPPHTSENSPSNIRELSDPLFENSLTLCLRTLTPISSAAPIKRDYATRHGNRLPIAHTQIRCVAPKKDDPCRLREYKIVPRGSAGRRWEKHVYYTTVLSLPLA